MAGGREQKVPCRCPECNGKPIEQAAWLRHNGKASSGMARMPEKIWMMGKWWVRENKEV